MVWTLIVMGLWFYRLGVQVLLLVRDPRGTMQSRHHREWCPGNPDCNDPAWLCRDLVSDYHTAKKFLKKFPYSFRFVLSKLIFLCSLLLHSCYSYLSSLHLILFDWFYFWDQTHSTFFSQVIGLHCTHVSSAHIFNCIGFIFMPMYLRHKSGLILILIINVQSTNTGAYHGW